MICSSCMKEKPLSDFNFRNKHGGIYQRSCKECTRIAGKLHYTRNREKVIARSVDNRQRGNYWYAQFKNILECEVCGENFGPCLEFHHTNPDVKERDPSTQYNWTKFKKEIEECVVVCANCHRKIHYGNVISPSPSSLMDRALVFETSRWKFDSSLGHHNPRIKR